MSRTRLVSAFGLTLLASLCGASPAFAQDKPKDDLDRLLEKIENKPADAKPDDKTPEPAKPDDKKDEKPKEKAEKPAADKPKGEVDPKDKDLDDLLGKLGGSTDTPDAKGKPSPPPAGGGDGPKPPPMPGEEKKKGGELTDEEKKIDDVLEPLTGKIRRPKNQQQQQGEGSGAIGEAIKQMREVEERLGKTDTGEKTREEQKEIVKKLDTILQQIRQQQGKGQGRQMAQGTKQGDQPGQQDNPNPNQQGTGPQKPKTPSIKDMMGNDKQPWGNLPSSMRQDMQNVAKEGMLESKKSQIERYFTTILKKSTTKE